MTLYIMCGLSRAGKTTFAKALAAKTGAELVSLDDEMMLHPGRDLFWVDGGAYAKVRRALEAGKDAIYDSMALCRGERELILRHCTAHGCRTICVFVDTDYEVIKQRGGVIPFDALKPPKPDEGFGELWTVKDKTIWRMINNGNSNTQSL